MKEWILDGPPVVDDVVDVEPEMTTERARRWPPRARWAQGALAGLAIWLAYAGVFLLISRPLGYTPAAMLPPIVLQAVGMIVVYALIAFIAWRTGRLV